VEPQPDAFAKLKQNYAAASGMAFENAAIAETDGEKPLYRFKPGPGVPDWAGCLASFSRATVVGNFHNVKGEVEAIPVPTLTFASLVRRHGLQHVDLLQIDTEGFDDRVLKMVNFSVLKPTIIEFEHGFLSASAREECVQLLTKQGYKVTNNGTDTVAYLEPPEQSLVDTHVWVE
jgi:FkbM family methyltransferase